MSKKTLVVINSYNLKAQTDLLYKQLHSNQNGNYDTVILDNGSLSDNISSNAFIKLEKNVYYSGAFNYALELALANRGKYDSVQFVICSLSLTGYNWVNATRKALFAKENIAIVSPTVISSIDDQNAWPQMHNWCLQVPRKVRWVDFQCAMFNLDFIEKIFPLPDFGISYGYDVYCGIKAEELGYDTYALDYVYAYHAKKATFKTKDSTMTSSEYGQMALKGMYDGFSRLGQVDKLNEFRTWASNYRPQEV